MPDLHPEDQIGEYLAGELDAAAAEQVRAYLEATPECRGFMAGVRAAARGEDWGRPSVHVDASLADLLERIHTAELAIGRKKRTRPTSNPLSRTLWTSLAALAVLVLTIATAIPAWHGRSTANTPPQRFTTYETGNGERATIVLTDGTRVMLNVASRIDVREGFGHGERTVYLHHGQAYFRVAQVADAPFVVDASGVQTRVLGTEFGVRAYTPAIVEVAVRSGRVAVNNAVLGANDIARATPSGRVLVARHQSLDAALGFVTGRLVLTRRPLRDAVMELDRWYDADVRLGTPELGDLPLQGTLVSGSIGDLMELLQKTLDVRVVRAGRTLTLYSH